MLQARKAHAAKWTLLLLAVLALSLPTVFTGCGACQQEPQPKPQVTPPAAPPPPPKAAEPTPPPPPPAAALGAVVPVTLNVLKLAPESAMLTLALPPVQGLVDKGVAVAKRVVPAGVDVDAEVAKNIAQMAQDAGVPEAKTLADIARAKGFNPDAPIAVFADFTQSAASAKKAMETIKAEMDAAKAAPAAEAAAKPDAPKPDAAKPEEAKPDAPKPDAPKPDAAPAAPAAPKPPDMDKVLAELKVPALAGVLGCADAAKVEATIAAVLPLANGYVDPAKVETVDVGGVPVKCYDPEKLAYAIAGDKLVIGNSLEMVKGVLARVSAPAAVRYGTTECPASSPDEIVMLSRMDKFAPLIKELLPMVMAMQPGAAQMPAGQLDYLNKTLDALGGEDPGVMTLEWTEKKLELLTRYDLSKHPGLAELTGEAQPFRLATMLPDSTLLMLALRINDKAKTQFKEGWVKSLPDEVKNEAGVGQALSYVSTIMDVIGDELTIGLAGSPGGLPQVYLLAGLGNVEQAKNMLSLYAPMTPSEPHAGVDISLLALPSPVPFYIAFADSTLILCNDLEKLKGIIDLSKEKAASKLFASLDPALDPTVPRFGTLLIKSGLVTDVVRPLSMFAGGIPPEIQGPVDKVISVVREVRATKELKNNWASGAVSIYLN